MAKHVQNDRYLFGILLILTVFGLVMVFSASAVVAERVYGASYYFLKRQMLAAAIGLAGMFLFMQLDYQRFRHPAVVFGSLGLVVVALVVVLFVGRTAGTNRFYRVGGFSLQPSEFAKPVLILFLAWFLERRYRAQLDWRTLGPAAFLMLLLAALVVKGRDLGTAIVLVAIAGVILWVAGLSVRYFALGAAVLAPLAALAIWIERYRWERFLIFLDPWKDPQGKGFQIIQSMIALGTGGWTGAGPMASTQKLYYLPAPHTDFIFSVIGEEFGLFGTTALVGVFFWILWRGVRAALRAGDPFGVYLAVGVTAMLVCQAFINISVAVNLAPTKGMPLPLISYGGSALISAMWASGLLLSVSQRSG
jgi:cell division protein FtsW